MAPEGASREQHPAVSVILIALGVAVASAGVGYGWGSLDSPGPGFVPFLAGAAIAGFSAVTLVQTLTKGWRPPRELWTSLRWRRPFVTTVCLLLYSIVLRDLGFLISTFVLTAYLYRMLEPSRWTATVLAALVTTLGFYLVFQIWLDVQLPRGPLAF